MYSSLFLYLFGVWPPSFCWLHRTEPPFTACVVSGALVFALLCFFFFIFFIWFFFPFGTITTFFTYRHRRLPYMAKYTQIPLYLPIPSEALPKNISKTKCACKSSLDQIIRRFLNKWLRNLFAFFNVLLRFSSLNEDCGSCSTRFDRHSFRYHLPSVPPANEIVSWTPECLTTATSKSF